MNVVSLVFVPAIFVLSSCAHLSELAKGNAYAKKNTKPYSILLDENSQIKLKFNSPFLTKQNIKDEKDNLIRYKAQSNNGIKIVVFAEKIFSKKDHRSCRGDFYKQSADSLIKYVKKIDEEHYKSELLEAEFAVYKPKLNLGKKKLFASAHAYFLVKDRCYNFHVIKSQTSEDDKQIVTSIVRSIAYH